MNGIGYRGKCHSVVIILGKATWNIYINIINICNDIYEKRLFEPIKSLGIQCESKIHVMYIMNIL